jgi:ABC-type amino acid transport substrate-binding protein
MRGLDTNAVGKDEELRRRSVMKLKLKNTRSLSAAVAVTALTNFAMLAAVAPAEAEKLLVGNEGVYPPFSIVASDGTLTGFEPDLAREVCKRMGDDCEFVVMDFKALIPSILQANSIFSPRSSRRRPSGSRS